MKQNRGERFSSAFFLLCVLTLQAVSADADTCIKIRTEVSEQKRPHQIVPAIVDTATFWISEERALAHSNAIGATRIWEFKTGKLYSLFHKMKIYTVWPTPADTLKMFDDVVAAMSAQNAASALQRTVEETEEVKEIDGFRCRKYLLHTLDTNRLYGETTSEESTEEWTSDEIDIDRNLFLKLMQKQLGKIVGDELFDKWQAVHGFPVLSVGRVQEKDSTGTVVSSFSTCSELIEYKKMEAPKGTYEIPAGYKLYPSKDD